MSDSTSHTLAWIRVGAVAGLASCVVYPMLIFLPWSHASGAALAAAWGPLLAVGSLGLGRLLQVQRRSVSVQLAMLFNFAGGVLITAMLLVQIAIRAQAQGTGVGAELVGVWLGLDVAWDVYIGLGTGLFAMGMLGHPRFGVLFALPGLLVALGLLSLNLFTFPTPPGEAGLFDLGPFVGLWYLVVSIRSWRSLGWAEEALGAPSSRTAS